jgi:5-methylcytosine-specific restriction endonuclease McrA
VGAVYCSSSCQESFHARYFWDAARSQVLRRDGFRCQRCGRKRSPRSLEVDHIVERVRGGALRDPSNLQTLCRRCHARKTREVLHALGERTRRRSVGYPGLDSGIGEIVFGEPSTSAWD